MMAGSLLASCAMAPTPSGKSGSKEYFSEKEYGVSASPRLVASGDSVPQGGGRYQVGEPYKVRGKTYRPKEDPNYSAVGLASWYGSAFHGRKTANGEIYDMGDLTAAHPTLPLPSYVRVTNLANDRSVIVRVNDRGPFAKGRVVDVSATVADMLGFKRAGTAKVKVQYVGPARMDGHDQQMLLASYHGPNDFGHDTLFASKVTATPKNVVLAALTKPRRGSSPTGPDRSMELFGAQRVDAPAITAPAYVPTTYGNSDPLGPLILSTGFASSYAQADQISGAQHASAVLAERGKSLAIVQLGTFGEKTNAERIAARFGEFGKVTTHNASSGGRTLYLVQVLIDRSIVRPESIVASATAAGLNDAYVVSP
jgi:peptidoglycan lytic transglycosylase